MGRCGLGRKVAVQAGLGGGEDDWEAWVLKNPAPRSDHGNVEWGGGAVDRGGIVCLEGRAGGGKDRRVVREMKFVARDAVGILEEYGGQFG